MASPLFLPYKIGWNLVYKQLNAIWIDTERPQKIHFKVIGLLYRGIIFIFCSVSFSAVKIPTLRYSVFHPIRSTTAGTSSAIPICQFDTCLSKGADFLLKYKLKVSDQNKNKLWLMKSIPEQDSKPRNFGKKNSLQRKGC